MTLITSGKSASAKTEDNKIKMVGYVYRIFIPASGQFYIGQRRGEFDKNYWGSGTRLLRWIKKYGNKGLIRDVLGFKETQKELDDFEVYEIAVHRQFGFDLLNILNGGMAGPAGHKLPSWLIDKMKRAKLGKVYCRKWTDEQREKIIAANTGQKRDDVARANIKAGAAKRKPVSEQARANMRAARLGRKFSPLTPEHRAKIAESNRITKSLKNKTSGE